MLHLIHSNHLEQLAQDFSDNISSATKKLSPFKQELVVVQNAGMGRWLSLQAAKHTGIAANMRYLFPAELTWELLRAVLLD
ncbi:MAG: exodeoxyribonuclease V subunit gamma, partial [bacterium]